MRKNNSESNNNNNNNNMNNNNDSKRPFAVTMTLTATMTIDKTVSYPVKCIHLRYTWLEDARTTTSLISSSKL